MPSIDGLIGQISIGLPNPNRKISLVATAASFSIASFSLHPFSGFHSHPHHGHHSR